MATVRTTAPRREGNGGGGSGGGGGGSGNGGGGGGGGNKKRKRSRSGSSSRPPTPGASGGGGAGVSSAELAAVRAVLAGLEKWQLAVNIDMSEIRKECMRVRREANKSEDQATLAQTAAQASAADAQALKKSVEQQSREVSAAVKDVEKEVHAVGEASAAATAGVDAVKTKLVAVERHLEELAQRSIDEEYMMTQLSALQERYDTELARCRDECGAMVKEKQREIDALEAKLSAMETNLRAEVATANKRHADKAGKLSERVEEVEQSQLAGLQGVHEQLQTDVEALKDQIYAAERNLDDVRALTEEQLRAPPPLSPLVLTPVLPPAVPLEAMQAIEDELQRVRGDMDVMKNQLFAAQRDLDNVRAYAEEQQRRPLPPHPDPRPIVPIEAFQAVEDKLRRMDGDFHAVASDFESLTGHVETRVGKLHDHFSRRLQDLSAELFNSLSRDTSSHIAEILRLKDAMFDMQGDIRTVWRTQHEVIVIEEDDEEEEEEEEEAQAGVPPNMAPPDIVLEDDVGFNRDESDAGGSEIYNTVSPSPSEAKMHSMDDLNTGLLLYFCLGGAPNLDAAWTSHFYQLRNDECVEMPRALSFQRHHCFLQTLPMYLTQCVIQSVVVSASASDEEGSTRVDDLEPPDVRARFGSLVAEIRLEWTNATVLYLEKQAAAMRLSTGERGEIFPISANPIVDDAAGPGNTITGLAVEWLERQSSALLALVLARRREIGALRPLDQSFGASPAVHILVLMFDVVRVHTGIPQLVTLRLNAFGAKMVMHLWSLLLARLPYLFFADWTWLEDQSEPKGELPPLGFCHLLAVILASNSLVDSTSLSSEEVHKEVIELLFQALHVNGQSLSAMSKSSNAPERCLPIGRADAVSIELINLDQRLVSTLALDGCFEVCAAISGATE